MFLRRALYFYEPALTVCGAVWPNKFRVELRVLLFRSLPRTGDVHVCRSDDAFHPLAGLREGCAAAHARPRS